MNEPLDPVSKRDLDAAITVVMIHTHDQQRLLVNGLITGAIVLIIAFLLADVVGVLIVLVLARIIQFFHPSKKDVTVVKNRWLKQEHPW